MAGAGKPSIVAAFIVAFALVAPTEAMAQFPIPMIPNFNFGPQQHYRSGSPHYSTHSRSSRHEEEKPAPVDKTKEKDATQPDPAATTAAARTQQTSGPPPSHDAAPSGGSGTPASPPPASPAQKPNDDQPAFQPSR